uniref:Uncharacterized protein n=1 Tax=Strombidium rassoulzadegani TaxID=1082188 RepID=A0A7S3CKF5_9SPIT|mmetsp:Transcript_14397/g.24535  ORF Transcript_14397/g.24535 Transcript_14397/m.24535 type:complete len:218 (+) Transcript_14397:36-689(+)
MDSRNEFVRQAYFRFCNWGKRIVVEHSKPYKGGPTPLLKNISIPYFQKLSAVSLIFFILCMVEYIVIEEVYRKPQFTIQQKGLPNKYTCYENANVSFIVNIVSMAVNFGWYSYLQNVEYAADQTWSKFQMVLGVNIAVQMIGATMAGYLVITEQLDKFDECFEDLKGLYIRQYIYTLGNYVVIIFQVTSLTRMILEYTINTTNYFYYRVEPSVRVKM